MRLTIQPYGLFEVPSQIALMYIAPHTWIGVMGLAWGTTMTLSGLVQNFSGAMAARFFLGGEPARKDYRKRVPTHCSYRSWFLPCCSGDLWRLVCRLISLSCLANPRYHPLNLQVRIAVFYTMGQFSGAFGGLLAYAIHYMDGAGGLASWRWWVPTFADRW